MSVRWRCFATIALLVAATVDRASAAEPGLEPTAPRTSEPARWYGWETLLFSAPSAALYVYGDSLSDTNSRVTFFTLAYVDGLFAPSLADYLNGGSQGKARVSFQIAGAGLALGLVGGLLVAYSQDPNKPPVGRDILPGMEIGLLAGDVVDAVAMAWTRGDDSRVEPRARSPFRLRLGRNPRGGGEVGVLVAF